jgi:copper chaperone CopZ
VGRLLSSKERENRLEATRNEGGGNKKARVVVAVKEISCTLCAKAIEKQVKKMSGIEDVGTAIMLNKVVIDYNPELVDLGAIRKAINKTGFKSHVTIEENR